jgi:hypothetical protein
MSVSVSTRISSSDARDGVNIEDSVLISSNKSCAPSVTPAEPRAREMFARAAGFPTVKTPDAPPPTQHARSYCVPTLLPLTLMAAAEPSRGPYATPPIN